MIDKKVLICMQGVDGPEVARKIAAQELQLTQAALLRNPKSYGSWHYRKLITEQQLLPLENELQLVQQWVLMLPQHFKHIALMCNQGPSCLSSITQTQC